MRNQRGYTVWELIMCILGLVALGGMGTLMYWVIRALMKFVNI